MNIKTIGVAFLAGAMVAGCGKNEETKAEVPETPVSTNAPAPNVAVATVNGEKLMRAAVDADVAKILEAQGKQIPAEQMDYARKMFTSQVVQSFIVEKVLVAKAKELGVTVTDADRKAREDEFMKSVAHVPNAPKSMAEYYKKFPLGEARAKADFENNVLIEKMIKDICEKQSPGRDYEADAQQRIDLVISNNASAAAADAKALEKIKALKAELDKTPADQLAAKFAELAKANSGCPSKAKGGDLGEFTHGQMVPEFDKAAFALEVGKVSEPVKTQFGYHLVMTTKKTPAVDAKGDQPAVPEKVQASHILIKVEEAKPVPKKEDVVKQLKRNAERKVAQDFVMKALRAAKIETIDEFKHLLPPPEQPVAPAPVENEAKK